MKLSMCLSNQGSAVAESVRL